MSFHVTINMHKALVAACLACGLGAAHPADDVADRTQAKPQVHVAHVFAMPADAVWKKLGRFCGIAEWQSLVASCLTQERSDGFYRVVVMKDHTAYTERLERFSHDDRSFRYSIVQGPLSVNGYVSDFRILPMGDGRSRLVWRAWYDTPRSASGSVNDAQIANTIEGLYRNGIKGMSALLHAQP